MSRRLRREGRRFPALHPHVRVAQFDNCDFQFLALAFELDDLLQDLRFLQRQLRRFLFRARRRQHRPDLGEREVELLAAQDRLEPRPCGRVVETRHALADRLHETAILAEAQGAQADFVGSGHVADREEPISAIPLGGLFHLARVPCLDPASARR